MQGGQKIHLSRKHRLSRQGRLHPTANSWPDVKNMGKSPVLICPKCHAVYFDKAWHSNKFLEQAYKWNKGVRYELCPEDKLIKQGRKKLNYEGELFLKNIPEKDLMEIARQVRNIAKRARLRDPQDKVMRLEIKKNSIKVLTTENQLAVSIGKQVARAYKGGELEIKWSDKDKPARAVWKYKK